MLNDWLNWLKQPQNRKPARIAIVGIGQELRGDDAVGLMVVQALKPALARQQSVLVIEGGQAPENQTGVIRRFVPDLVLLVDAAQMGTAIGEIRWLTLELLDGLSASTHTLPLSMIAKYLNTELGCEVALLGIQPAQMVFGVNLSPVVQEALNEVIKGITTVLLDS